MYKYKAYWATWRRVRAATVVFLSIILCACVSSTPRVNVPTPEKDRGPDRDIDVSHIPNASPTPQVITQAGNKSPYSVLGKTYHINFNAKGFTQEGYASWYGKKFHGRKTSNGETYDMFAMTAAHKTLPIPVYVKVTNLESGKNVIVRVNDRGPFHGDRIIDLSYTAAKKLNIHNRGVAKVKIEVVENQNFPVSAEELPKRITKTAHSESGTLQTYLQAGAFSKKLTAERLQRQLASVTDYSVSVRFESALHKVLIGPIVDNFDLMVLRKALMEANISEPLVVEL